MNQGGTMAERNSSSSPAAAGSGRTAAGASPAGTASTAESTTGGMTERLRDKASSQLNTQKDRATDGLGSVAHAVRESTKQLREQRHDTLARYVEQAADQIDRFSRGLRNKDVGELARDAQRFAQRRPALFVGSAFAIGLVGARFLKSSADRGEFEYGTGRDYGYGRERERERGAERTGPFTGDYGAERRSPRSAAPSGPASTGSPAPAGSPSTPRGPGARRS